MSRKGFEKAESEGKIKAEQNKKKIFYCKNCGQTIFDTKMPKRCPNCSDPNIGRILTDNDLPLRKR